MTQGRTCASALADAPFATPLEQFAPLAVPVQQLSTIVVMGPSVAAEGDSQGVVRAGPGRRPVRAGCPRLPWWNGTCPVCLHARAGLRLALWGCPGVQGRSGRNGSMLG